MSVKKFRTKLAEAKTWSDNHGTFWRVAGWMVIAMFVIGVSAVGVRFLWSVWKRFPPTDAVTAWTMTAGVGAVFTGIATLFLSAFALRGLLSLRLTRIEMLDRASTQAKVIALQRLEEVATEIIDMNTAILDTLSAGSVQVFLGANETVEFNPDPSDLTRANVWKASLPPGAYSSIVDFLNRLEAWCAYFTNGVAADAVAFGPIAPLLRSWVGQYYPILLLSRAKARSGGFPNLIHLYTLWTAKLDEPKLARLHQDLVAQMDRTQSKLTQARLPSVGPKI